MWKIAKSGKQRMSVSLESQQILRWHSGAPEYEKETLNKITSLRCPQWRNKPIIRSCGRWLAF